MNVSICLPVMNGASYLNEAIESVMRQEYRDFELLIADDCSTDESWSIIEQYAAADKRLKIFRNDTRLGLFENYNKLMSEAEGTLIKLFAQDDILQPMALSILVEAIEQHPSAIMSACKRQLISGLSAHDAQLADDSTDIQTQNLASGLNIGLSVIRSCLQSYKNLVGEPVAVLIRNSADKQFFDPAYLSLGDMDLWFRLLQKGDLVYVVDNLVQFRKHDGAQTQTLLKDIDWVLDFLRLSHAYETELTAMGLDRLQYCTRFLELAAPIVEANVSVDRHYIDSLAPHKELAYHLLRRLPEAVAGQNNYNSVLASTSWRVTKPLRALRQQKKKT